MLYKFCGIIITIYYSVNWNMQLSIHEMKQSIIIISFNMIYQTANNFLFIKSIHWIIIRESDGLSISIMLEQKKSIFHLVIHYSRYRRFDLII